MSQEKVVPVEEAAQVLQQIADPDVMVLLARKGEGGVTIKSISCSRCGASANNSDEIVHKDSCTYR